MVLKLNLETKLKIQKIKKTYEPGPATYDMPGTVGNIPKYLRVKEERKALENMDDKSEDLDLL